MKQLYFVLFFMISTLAFSQNAQKDTDIDGFKLYPNPVTNGKVHIQTKLNARKKVFVFDVFGTNVLQTEISGKELNVSRLNKGVYILRVFENNKVATRKLIIK